MVVRLLGHMASYFWKWHCSVFRRTPHVDDAFFSINMGVHQAICVSGTLPTEECWCGFASQAFAEKGPCEPPPEDPPASKDEQTPTPEPADVQVFWKDIQHGPHTRSIITTSFAGTDLWEALL